MFGHIKSSFPQPSDGNASANKKSTKPPLPASIWSSATVELIKQDIAAALRSEQAQKAHLNETKSTRYITTELPTFLVWDEEGNCYLFEPSRGGQATASFSLKFFLADNVPPKYVADEEERVEQAASV